MTVPSLLGALLAGVAYFLPNTGVDGTLGALLALIGAVSVTLGSLLAMTGAVRAGVLTGINILMGIAALLTATAGYFLMQYGCAIAMGLAFAGLIFAATTNPRRTA